MFICTLLFRPLRRLVCILLFILKDTLLIIQMFIIHLMISVKDMADAMWGTVKHFCFTVKMTLFISIPLLSDSGLVLEL